jgi:hypothetical protein
MLETKGIYTKVIHTEMTWVPRKRLLAGAGG